MLKHSRISLFIAILLCSVFSASAQLSSGFQFGKGIKFQSENGGFEVTLKSRFQTLYSATTTLEDGSFGDISSNLLVRRSRLKFDGYATPKLKFKMEFGLSNRDFSSPLPEAGSTANMILDAVFMYDIGHNTKIWFGQTKLPGNRERVISSQALQFADRSLLNKYFNIDRDQGVQLRHTTKTSGAFLMREMFSISKGEGRNITADNFGGYDYTARLEILPFGEFSKKGDYISSAVNYVKGQSNDDDGKLAIGITYDYNNGTSRSAGQLGSFRTDTLGAYLNANMNTLFVDAIYKYKRLSYMGEYARRNSTVEDDYYVDLFSSGWSYNNQMGCMLSSKSEIAVRHTHVNDLRGITDMYTLGFSRYVVKHSLKFQTDFSVIQNPDGTTQPLFRFQTEVAF